MEKKYPFKFLDAYTQVDTSIFFGRDEEIEALYTMVFQTNIVVVYGASGTGKTSLIQCGLASKFQSHDWLALNIRRGSNFNESFKKALVEASGNLQTGIDVDWFNEGRDETPLMALEQALQRSFKAIFLRHFRPIYLLFDQFEELFILGSPEEQTQFIKTVQAILQVKQPVKLIFSIREEYLGELYEFEKAVPQLLRKKLRVEPMNLGKVHQVIVGATTYETSNVRLDTPDTQLITAGIFEKIKGNDKKITIQLPYLQVFLDRLYLSMTKDESLQADALITLNVLNKLADIGDVLSNFLEEQVGVISRVLNKPPLEVSTDTIWRILSPFVTLEGTKEPISQQSLLDRMPDLDPTLVVDSLKALSDRRILRSSEGTDFYEIAHDSLALKIAGKRSEEEKTRMQIQRLLKNHFAFREREVFTEKQLNFIEPHLGKMKLTTDEQALIEESRLTVRQLKKKQQRDKWLIYGILALIPIAFILYFFVDSRQQHSLAEQKSKQAQYFELTEQSTLSNFKEGDATKAFRYAQYAMQKDSTSRQARAAFYSAVFPSQNSIFRLFYRSLPHTGVVNSAMFSSDGKKVLTASWDNTVRLWDADSGKFLATLKGHTGEVKSAVFSPGSDTVLTASSDKTARLWDAASGRCLATLQGHTDVVNSAVFSRDGKKVVTASRDMTARLWDAASGRCLDTLQGQKGHNGEVKSAVFSFDGKTVLTASFAKTARLWDADSGKLLFTLKGHTSLVNSAVFSPDGKTVLTASFDSTARLWDAASGDSLFTLKGHTSVVYSAVFSPDGKTVLTASRDNTARLWDAASGKLRFPLKGHTDVVNSAVFSPGGKTVLTASWDNTARLWETTSGDCLATLQGHTGVVNSAVFSPDSLTVLTASSDKTARLWNAANGRSLTLKGHTGVVNSAVFSPDSLTVLTASSDNTARLWDAASGRCLNTLKGHTDVVYRAVFSSDGKTVLTASRDMTARLWNAASGKLQFTLQHSSEVTSAVFFPVSNTVLTASFDKTARLWDAASGKLRFPLKGHTDSVYSAVFSFDGKTVLTASSDKTARLWDAASGRCLDTLQGHTGKVYSAVFSPNGKTVLTTSADSTARLWDAASGRCLNTLKGHTDVVYRAVFSSDGKTVLTASRDMTARLWNAASGKLQFTLQHSSEVKRAVFSPDGKTVLTASLDNTVRLWETASGRSLATLQGHTGEVNSAVFSPDGKTVLTASRDNKAMLWLISIPDLIREISGKIDDLSPQDKTQYGIR